MKRSAWLKPVLALALLTWSAPAARAHEHEGADHQHPPYRYVHWDRVEADKVPEFEAAMKAWAEAFAEAEMDSSFYWFTAAGPQFTYLSVNPVVSFAQLDQEEARFKQIQEALGIERVAELMAMSGSVRHHWNEFAEHLPELSYAPARPAASSSPFVNISEHWVRPGMEDRFKELAARVVEAHVKAGAPLGYDAYQVRFGDASFVFVTEAESAAQFYAAPDLTVVLAESLGEEAAGEIFAAWRDCVTNWDSTDFTARPDLSYLPAPRPPAEAGGEKTADPPS